MHRRVTVAFALIFLPMGTLGMDVSVPWWADEAGSPSAAGSDVGVLKHINNWTSGSVHKWLLLSGAVDPPETISFEPKALESCEVGGAFLRGINQEFRHMEEAVKDSLFNKVQDMYITVTEAKSKIKHFFSICMKKQWVPMIYYSGHGERGTGNWCFADGVLSFSDVRDLLPTGAHWPWIFADACYSGHWANLARVTYDGKIQVVAAAPYFMTAFATRDKGGEFTSYITGQQDAKSLKRPMIYGGYSLRDYPLPTSVKSYPYYDRIAGETSFGQRFVIAQHFYDGKYALVLGRLPDYDWGTLRWAACTRDSYESLVAWMEEQWDQGLDVMHFSCDGKRFGAYAVESWGAKQWMTSGRYDYIKELIQASWKEGLSITSVCPGIGHGWFVIMTKCNGDHLHGNSTGAQWFGLLSSWKDVSASISQQRQTGKIVTALAAKEDSWFLVMTESTRAQEYVWGPKDGTFPDVKDPEVWNKTLDITTILRDPEDV